MSNVSDMIDSLIEAMSEYQDQRVKPPHVVDGKLVKADYTEARDKLRNAFLLFLRTKR
jgi:hypothetical protein